MLRVRDPEIQRRIELDERMSISKRDLHGQQPDVLRVGAEVGYSLTVLDASNC